MKPSGNGDHKPVPLVGQVPNYPATVVQRARVAIAKAEKKRR